MFPDNIMNTVRSDAECYTERAELGLPPVRVAPLSILKLLMNKL